MQDYVYAAFTQPENATDLLQVVNFPGLAATSLLILSSCRKFVKIRLVASLATFRLVTRGFMIMFEISMHV